MWRFLVIYLWCRLTGISASDNNVILPVKHDPKFFPMLSLMRLSNQPCVTVNNKTGTCVSSRECSTIGGVGVGTCAIGFGVCCIAELGCGAETSANSTTFVGPDTLGTGLGMCEFRVNKMSHDICQMRLDFDEAVLNQPIVNQATPSSDGNCLQDAFTVSGSDELVPVLCGEFTGFHWYIRVTDSQTVILKVTSITSFPARRWKIKITQVTCGSIIEAPDGCSQFFMGSQGIIKSPNHIQGQKGLQINGLSYGICIRNERGYCGLCYDPCPDVPGGSFSLDNSEIDENDDQDSSEACTANFLMIPCGQVAVDSGVYKSCHADKFCGQTFANHRPDEALYLHRVCSFQKPFTLNYRTTDPAPRIAGTVNRGFCLNYLQVMCLRKN